MSEHSDQVALFQWARLSEGQIPELTALYAIPNGGLRNKRVAQKLKASGVRAGVFDISLDVPRGGFHGLKIELKFGRNQLTEHQKVWKERYEKQGYKIAVCYNWEAARDEILEYLIL